MRHRKKKDHLGKAADQRKALVRSLATQLFMHDQITTTLTRAKVLQRRADKIVTLAKQGKDNVHAIREVAKLVYDQDIPEMEMDDERTGKTISKTVLRRIFREVAPKFEGRKGGYTRIIPAPPRRGDAAPMAVIQFVED